MNKQKINIWGRDFELEVVYDCYEGEDVLPVQTDALNQFLRVPDLIDTSKVKVIEYCLSRNSAEIGSNTIENIFKFVMPKSIYVQRSTDNSHIVGLMCDYRFNIDDGIAVVFKNEKFDAVGSQNIIL